MVKPDPDWHSDAETINGTMGNDLIIGNELNSRIFGKGGKDYLSCQECYYLLKGSRGHDVLLGVMHKDIMEGEDGNDILDGGTSLDFVFGGNGDDILVYDLNQHVNVAPDPGPDTGAPFEDRYSGDADTDTIIFEMTSDLASEYQAAIQFAWDNWADHSEELYLYDALAAQGIAEPLNLILVDLENIVFDVVESTSDEYIVDGLIADWMAANNPVPI